MKRIALLVAAIALLAPQAFAGPWLTSLQAAQKQAKEKKQHIFVDMFADWCGWCHQLEQQVFPSEVFQKATKNHVLLRLNTEDGGDGQRLARQYQVSSLPTSLLLTPDMIVVGAIKGFMPPAPMAKAIEDLETKYVDFKKRVANEQSFASDYQKRLDLAREFRAHHDFGQAIVRFKKLTADDKVSGAIRDQAYFDLAVTQMMQKKNEDALKTIEKFSTVQTKGDPYERSQFLVGEIYIQQGDYARALKELQNFKTRFPNSPLLANVEMLLPQLERRVAPAPAPGKVQ